MMIKCPVDEMGKNSVTPSTTPNTNAFIIDMIMPRLYQ